MKQSNLSNRILLKSIQTTVVDAYPSATDKIHKYLENHYKYRLHQLISLFYHPKHRDRVYVRGDE